MGTVIVLLIGACVGVVVGALGAGGGILSVPILVYLLGQSPHAAASESLVIVIVTALVSLPSRAYCGQVRWREGVVVGLLSTVGAVGGSWLNALVEGEALMVAFSALLVVVAVVMAWRTRRAEHPSREQVDQMIEQQPPRSSWRLLVVVAATATGLLTGFFGVGGGFAVVPMLTLVLGLDIRRASATSLVVMVIAATAALAQRMMGPVEIDWALTLAFTAASAAGGAAGGLLSQRARASTLSYLFVALLLAVALLTAARALW
ncbi:MULTISPECIES: sulfite exporter TauE/SafE family protein [unclassified Actinomyces]|uniref:sulfite exporter TauE/SafE family protein n=1 Tax=unclassified Actinomyces TaxID=2609248 RepID=UPI0020172FFA|nr:MULTISPECIES: sulfite exporter TauE/SafE family protein [unclassified Actinomyces]MCL3776664.1 sulfite exporter TauE/SafE family protein [Actinomyces sp. AC-20-1]MCL3790182.1 sulfite exporter TauE/SafE family protein [Actinomyces sp. 187325]MCL3792474.1 sulfite exporter TauE/SafE family protein [Actinomyces sp. 186855]MCL3795011.1 sulfite exporter TauE/SafE family protein [Actinomyces sp. 217892]